MPIIIADAGPIIALIDKADDHHAWAKREVRPLPRPWIICAAAIAEVAHHFDNDPRALAALRKQVGDMQVKELVAGDVLALMEQYAPAMDYADACAVLLSKSHRGAVVVTTDHRDFATYKVPFISPKGAFHL